MAARAEKNREREAERQDAMNRNKGSSAIRFNLEQIHWGHLRRKKAFYSGVPMTMKEEWENPDELKSFAKVPDVLPIKPKETFTDVDYKELIKWEKPWTPEEKETAAEGEEEELTDQGPPIDQHLFQYDLQNLTEEDKTKYLSKFEIMRKRKLRFDLKPIFLINDPFAGAKGNVMPMIEERFETEQIKFEVSTSTGVAKEVYDMTLELDLEKYSTIAVAGDDATFQEAMNGMLARPDGKKLPLALLPNGADSDICKSLGIETLDVALDYIVKSDCIPIDTVRVLIDADKTEEVDPADMYTKCRHMLSDSSLIMPASVSAGSKSWWSACCSPSTAFSVSTWFKGLTCSFEPSVYAVEVDDVKVEHSNLKTSIIMVNNGKYSNGGCAINPFACLNDGLIDLTWVRDPNYFGMFGFREIINEAKVGGIQAYKKHSIYMRGRKIKCTFVKPEKEPAKEEEKEGENKEEQEEKKEEQEETKEEQEEELKEAQNEVTEEQETP